MFRLTRHGWREMLIGSVFLAIVAVSLGLWKLPLALVVLPIFVWLFAFFRDPDRVLPDDPRAIVSPADGRVSDITEIEHDPLVGGPAVRIGIFLSVFNVHVNRCPCDGRVLAVQYHRGKFISALRHGQASAENESNTIVLAEPAGDQPVVVVKQIAGAIARRIVCTISPGEAVRRGQRIGMIKFGSRTELTIAKRLEPTVAVRVGQAVRGAADVVALWGSPMQTVATREMTA